MNSKELSIVFMGTPEFSCPILQALAANPNFTISAVITQEDKPFGRKNALTPPPVKICAQSLKIPLYQTPSLRKDAELKETLKVLAPDFLLVVAFGQILDKETLQIPSIASINIHGSILPQYRGASPVAQALLNGDKITGVSIMLMNSKMDEGDVFATFKTDIANDDNILTLKNKLSALSSKNIGETLQNIAQNKIKAIAQNSEHATYCQKINRNDGNIDFANTSYAVLERKAKAFYSWPGIFFIHKNKIVKIIHFHRSATTLSPGQIDTNTNGKILIGLSDACIELDEFQVAGKNPMTSREFLRGNASFFNT